MGAWRHNAIILGLLCTILPSHCVRLNKVTSTTIEMKEPAPEIPDGWLCACRMNSEYSNSHKTIPAWLETHIKRVGDILISSDKTRCEALTALSALTEKSGKTCVAKEEFDNSCNHVMSRWWDMMVGIDDTEYWVLRHVFSKDLRNEPLMNWLVEFRPQRKGAVTKKDFLGFVIPRCTSVGIRVFAGISKFTEPGGAGALVDVFGRIPGLSEPDNHVVHVTYNTLANEFIAQNNWDAHVPIQVGSQVFKEHPRFALMRERFGVPHDFLHGVKFKVGFNGDSGAVFLPYKHYFLKCEFTSDWHSPVDWRSFHMRADDYFDYMRDNLDSMLPRFYSAYYDPDFQGSGQGAFCFAMNNWLAPRWSNDKSAWRDKNKASARLYDFKGSVIWSKRGDTNSRHLRSDVELSNCTECIFRDLNFVDTERFLLPQHMKTMMANQLEFDLKFLKSQFLMDFSFFLQVQKAGMDDYMTLSQICPGQKWAAESNAVDDGPPPFYSFFNRDHGFAAVIPDWDRVLHVYSMGLIDILQPYSLFKAIGTAYDNAVFPDQTGALAMNNIFPDIYADRMLNYMDKITVTHKFVESRSKPLKVRNVYRDCDVAYSRKKGLPVDTKHLPLCENIDLAEADPNVEVLTAKAGANFEPEEIERAQKASGLQSATCQKEPIAVFILGPASVGKSTASSSKPAELGIKRLNGTEDFDAVTIDGDLWRDFHGGYQDLVALGKQYDCIFKDAWTGASKYTKYRKKELFGLATREDCKMNMIIPETCTDFKRCETSMVKLRELGYTVHVVGIYASLQAVKERGLARADEEGKHYTGKFLKAASSIVPMMAMGTGKCQLVNNAARDPITTLSTSCPKMTFYDQLLLPQRFLEARNEIKLVANVGWVEFLVAEDAQGIKAYATSSKDLRICEEQDPDTYPVVAYRPEEITAAHEEAHLSSATCQEHPRAVLLVGPSSVNKDGVYKNLFKNMNGSIADNHVTIDGDIFRKNHAGFKSMREIETGQNCVFSKFSYQRIKKLTKVLKKNLFTKVIDESCKKNILVLDNCGVGPRCVDYVKELKGRGYVVDVIGIHSTMQAIQDMSAARLDRAATSHVSSFKVMTSLAAIVPTMSVANGHCLLAFRTDLSSSSEVQLNLDELCPGMATYNFHVLPDSFINARRSIAENTIGLEDFEAAEKEIGVSDADVLARQLCQAKNMKGAPIMSCKKGNPKLVPLSTQSGGGCSFFKGSMNNGFDFYLKSMYEHEWDVWQEFWPDRPQHKVFEGYVTPLYVWMDEGKYDKKVYWSVQPNVLAPGAEIYDIKGVPTLRYFRKTGVLRDANWIADFSQKRGRRASLEIDVRHYDAFTKTLAKDLQKLSHFDIVDHSMLVGYYAGVASSSLPVPSGGKTVWPAYDSRKPTAINGLLMGGIIDYLETTTGHRSDRPKPVANISVSIHSSPGVYACRMFLFITTQMLSPCKWPTSEACSHSSKINEHGCKAPEYCVDDFTRPLRKIFGDVPLVNDYTHHVVACESWDKQGLMLPEVAKLLTAHADEALAVSEIKAF